MTQATASHTRAQNLAQNGGTPVFDSPVAFMRPQLQPQDVEAAHEVLKSGMLRAAGMCGELETRFAQASQAKHALTCANGTCALQLAYGSLFERGDEVLVPAWTYIATASMLVAAGLKPVWVDSLEDTMQIDVADAAKKVTSKTKGIAATHLYGMPVDVHAISELAEANNLKVVYDCAQSHLATVGGPNGTQGIGTFGDACTYSFYATKNLGTGEGGIVTVNDDTLAHDVALLRSHGETDKYLHERIGFNYRMNDITGAIGCSRLDRLLDETNARRAAADQYDKVLGEIDGVIPPGRTKGADSAWHLYTAKLDLDQFDCDRDSFTKALNAEGVPTAVHYPRSLTHQPAFKEYVTDHPPVAEALASKVFCLPMHHELDGATIDRIGEAVAKVAAAYRR